MFCATIPGKTKITMGSLGGRKKEVYRKDGKGVDTDGKGIKSYGNRVGGTGREE